MDGRPPGGTLILKVAVGASRDLVEEVATAVARGYLRQIGDDRAIPIDIRLLVASGPALEPVVGLTRFELPPLADRTYRTELRRPRLHLDAAPWRMIVERGQPVPRAGASATVQDVPRPPRSPNPASRWTLSVSRLVHVGPRSSSDVDAMTIEPGPHEASPLRGVREMATAACRIDD